MWRRATSNSAHCSKDRSFNENSASLRGGLGLLAVCAVFSLIVELLTLQQVDSMRLYMGNGAILRDAGVALCLMLLIASGWWLGGLALGQMARIAPWTRNRFPVLCWSLWLLPPAAYLIARFSEAMREAFAPHSRVPLLVQIPYVIALVWVAVRLVRKDGLRGVQSFCKSRLAPLGWLHLALAFLCVMVLRIQGVHYFHNFQKPGRTATENLPDIYLITVDALRADGTSLHGYARSTTPNLDRWAARSITFNNFYANSNFTTPTTTSIETGKLPWSHRVFQFGGSLSPQSRGQNVAALLHERGYYTAMLSGNFAASPFRHGTLENYDAVDFAAPLGIEGAWLRWTNLIGTNTQSTLTYSILQRLFKFCQYLDSVLWPGRYFSPADTVLARARTLLEREDIQQPRFVWTHVFPPHDPYWPPPDGQGRNTNSGHIRCRDIMISNPRKLPVGTTPEDVRACYDEMVEYADRAVGGYLDWLQQTGRMERAVVIISSDHGESFEGGWYLHGGPRLQSGLIRVPLIVHLPTASPSSQERPGSGAENGMRVDDPAEQADLLPTLLDFAGVPLPEWTDGISLRPALEGKPLAARYLFSMNLERDRSWGAITKGTLAVFDRDFRLVRHLDSEKQSLYRCRDTSENNVIDSEPEAAARLQGVLAGKLKEVNTAFAAKRLASE